MSELSLGEMFGQFTRAAWRFEGRDVYTVRGEETRIATFLRGDPLPRKTRENNGWIATVEDARARDAAIGRVRVVGRPVTDYTRFEFAAYPDNVAAGEAVQAIAREALDPAWSEVPDFWLFDDTTVFVQHFDQDGQFLGAEQVHDIAPFLTIRQLLQDHTVDAVAFDLSNLPQQRTAVVGPPPPLNTPATTRG